MSEDYATWFARWSQEMASQSGSGKVPPPEEAVIPSGPGGPRPGFRSFPRSKQRGRVPGPDKAQVRKL